MKKKEKNKLDFNRTKVARELLSKGLPVEEVVKKMKKMGDTESDGQPEFTVKRLFKNEFDKSSGKKSKKKEKSKKENVSKKQKEESKKQKKKKKVEDDDFEDDADIEDEDVIDDDDDEFEF